VRRERTIRLTHSGTFYAASAPIGYYLVVAESSPLEHVTPLYFCQIQQVDITAGVDTKVVLHYQVLIFPIGSGGASTGAGTSGVPGD
jgi:hypothetical protein